MQVELNNQKVAATEEKVSRIEELLQNLTLQVQQTLREQRNQQQRDIRKASRESSRDSKSEIYQLKQKLENDATVTSYSQYIMSQLLKQDSSAPETWVMLGPDWYFVTAPMGPIWRQYGAPHGIHAGHKRASI